MHVHDFSKHTSHTWFLVTEEYVHKLYKLANCAYNTEQIKIGSTKYIYERERISKGLQISIQLNAQINIQILNPDA
jgi:hypothetical protein